MSDIEHLHQVQNADLPDLMKAMDWILSTQDKLFKSAEGISISIDTFAKDDEEDTVVIGWIASISGRMNEEGFRSATMTFNNHHNT